MGKSERRVQGLMLFSRSALPRIMILGVVCCLLPAPPARGQETGATGQATYYSDRFQGRPTASGELFDQEKLTAAHNSHPFGTQVRVTNLANDRSVVVTINDRMSPDSSATIDVTRRAAEELDFIEQGRTAVRVDVVND